MKLRRYLLIAIAICMLFPAVSSLAVEPKDSKAPLVYFPEKYYKFKEVVDGTEILHDFIVKNKGDAVLKINNVTAD